MERKVAPFLGKYLEICLNIDECRGPRGVRYKAGLLVFAILLSMCAGCEGQRSQARWLLRHWPWIRKAWIDAGGRKPGTSGIPSQSTISRFEGVISTEEIYSQMDQAERDSFRQEFFENTNGSEVAQLCVDGKARSGCTSELTGRTEIDVTIFSPSTGQVLSSRALEDKEGELRGMESMLTEVVNQFSGSVITCDAGMTSILKTDILARSQVDGIVQISMDQLPILLRISDLIHRSSHFREFKTMEQSAA